MINYQDIRHNTQGLFLMGNTIWALGDRKK